VIGRNIDTGGNIALAVTEAGAQYAPAGSFQHGKVDGRIAQHYLCRLRSGHITLDRDSAIDLNTAGRGHSDYMTTGFHNVGEHPRGGGFAVSTGHRGNRYTARGTRWVEHVEYLAGDIARFALTWRYVHAEARPRIYLDDGAADVFIRMGNIVGEEVDPAYIETNRTHRTYRHFAIVRVHHVGQINSGTASREISSSTKEKLLILFQYGPFIIAGICHQAVRLRVDFEAG